MYSPCVVLYILNIFKSYEKVQSIKTMEYRATKLFKTGIIILEYSLCPIMPLYTHYNILN